MAHSYDIVAYLYCADLYCPECIIDALDSHGFFTKGAREATVTTEGALDYLAKVRGIDRYDEKTYDSDDFPKVVFRDQIEGDEHCGRCIQEID